MAVSTFLLVLLLVGTAFVGGRYFPADSVKHELIKQGTEQERKREAQKLCGPCICVDRDGRISPGGYKPFSVLTLEHKESGVRFKLEDDWEGLGKKNTEINDSVVVHMRDAYDEVSKRVIFAGYSDLLKILGN